MKFKVVYLLLVSAIVFSCQNSPSSTEIAEKIEVLIGAAEIDSSLVGVYSNNDFEPIWVKSGGLKNAGDHYLSELEEISLDGLSKEDYWTEENASLIKQIKESEDPELHAKLDVLISESFLRLASDMNIGRVSPSEINIEWKMARKEPTVDYQELLLAIADGQSLEKSVDQLRPANAQYNELRELLRSQQENAQNQSALVESFDGKIVKGDSHPAISAIRQKLFLLNDLKDDKEGEETLYDEELYEAVKSFQLRHGLIDDGVIGADFVAAINYTHQDLISKILVNMERMRWLPDFSEPAEGKVIVNIPDFRLFYVQDEDTVLTSKVVVGKEYRQTPVFKSEMTYLVFSPTWTLPETILWEDAIPSIQKDDDYLEENHMQVLDRSENVVNYKKINWGKLQDKEDFPYLIRQTPGNNNPLGKVKFMFPNDYSIYIHDSPAQALFSQDERTFSSGCIRMENPREFASILLKSIDEWDEEKITEAMGQDEEQTVPLEEAQDVWILYLTVWNKNGKVEVREDVYEMDRKLAEALALPLSDNFL